MNWANPIATHYQTGQRKTGSPMRNPVLVEFRPGSSAIHEYGSETFRPPVTRSLALSDNIFSNHDSKDSANPSKPFASFPLFCYDIESLQRSKAAPMQYPAYTSINCYYFTINHHNQI
jgi:hypothetical protein